MRVKDVLQLIEQKLVLSGSGTIYKNPTEDEIYQASNAEYGLRFLLYNPTKSLYIANSNDFSHWGMIDKLGLPIKPYRKAEYDDIPHGLDANYLTGHADIATGGKLHITYCEVFEYHGLESVEQKLKHTWSWADKWFDASLLYWLHKSKKEISNKPKK